MKENSSDSKQELSLLISFHEKDSLLPWPDRKRGCLGYRGLSSPTFINPCFRYSPIVNIKNFDFKNPRFSNVCLVNIANWDFKNPRFSNIRVFDIHCRLISKTQIYKSWIFSPTFINPCFRYSPTVNIEKTEEIFRHLSGEYRKLRFQKIRDFQTSVFSIFTCSEYRKDGCLKISDFFKSKFSIFTIGEYRKHGFIKVGEKNPRFRPGPFIVLNFPGKFLLSYYTAMV